jgi:hypothetical protein
MSVSSIETIGASLKLMLLEEAIRRLINGPKGNGLGFGLVGMASLPAASAALDSGSVHAAPPMAAEGQASGSRLDTQA